MKFERYTTLEQVTALIQHHNDNEPNVALDFETTGLDCFTDKITDIVMTGYTYDHVVCFGGEFLSELLKITVLTIWQNFNYDFKIAYHSHKVDLRSLKVRDTMLLDHLVDENNEHGLDAIVQRRYGDNYKSVFWDKYKTFQDASVEDQLEYMCKDGYYTLLLYKDLSLDLQDQRIEESFINYIHLLAIVLLDSELQGVKVDLAHVGELGVELKTDIDRTLIEMRELCEAPCAVIEAEMWEKELDKRSTIRGKANVPRPEFNFSSSKQVCKLLYDKLGLPPQFNKKTKARSKDDKALVKIQHLHPVISSMQRLSKYEKMYGTFIQGVLERIRGDVVYPSFHVNGTVTGRISASSPNLQQLPASDTWSKLRGVFIPPTGYKIICADYSQLEICIAAHYSEDPLLLKMVRNGESMHDYTAKATGLTRDQAKKMNFTVLYGGTEYKVSEDLGCSIEQAKEYLNLLLSTYKGLKRLIDDCHAKAEHGVPIQSLFGRIRHFPGKYDQFWELKKAQRQSFNSLIQGTGADFTHHSFVEAAWAMQHRGWGRALFPVHDELVVQAKDTACKEVTSMLQSVMSGMGKKYGLLVPLTVEVSEPADRWMK